VFGVNCEWGGSRVFVIDKLQSFHHDEHRRLQVETVRLRRSYANTERTSASRMGVANPLGT
jgi:hypothetical protein